ncbi:hypothetical protein [Ferribacterium limneticum]|uniref:hypothetical protein n=1 Tax=Ferribacterium limneticum TaxID=76259 RepID=UPI001CFB6E4C|nr:hypothetical protein [Ferribacterium limneticum]UCV17798.1 hypothetical protein KI610_13340 [Ferribacterium limneticum]
MKMTTPDGMEIMKLDAIERRGNDLALKANIMGAMPMTVLLSPSEARKALRMLNWRLVLFLLTFLFRK